MHILGIPTCHLFGSMIVMHSHQQDAIILDPYMCYQFMVDKMLFIEHIISTCAASRAVILDVVNSSNTQNFIQSFKRFIARRGCPSIMISDNGASFTADETQKFVADRFIEWKFSVAKATNWGGMW